MNPEISWISKDRLNSYGNLLFMRPPKTDLYRYIVSGTADQQLRKKYSYALEYPVTGAVREYPGNICIAKTPNAPYEYVNISYLWYIDLTLYAASSPQEFVARYPQLESWIPVMLPNGLWVARPPPAIYIEDYV